MGYGIMPYLVSLTAVEAAIGSRDADLEAKIVANHSRRMARIDDNFNDTPVASILHDLFQGEVNHPHQGYKYWYAIELIVITLGRMLHNGAWYPADIDSLWSLQGCGLYDLNEGMDLPSPDDFPTVFTLRFADLDIALADARTKMKDAEQLEEFQSWCQSAKVRQHDLVLYYY